MKCQHRKYIAQGGDWGIEASWEVLPFIHRCLNQRLSSKSEAVSWFSESGHLLLVRSRIRHILAGLGPPGSRASMKLNQESTQEHCPLSPGTAWIRWMAEKKWRYQDSETEEPEFPTHYFFIRTLYKTGKLICTLPSQKSNPHRCTWILTC